MVLQLGKELLVMSYVHLLCSIFWLYFCVDDAKCEVITCTALSSYAVTDRGKVCNFTNRCFMYIAVAKQIMTTWWANVVLIIHFRVNSSLTKRSAVIYEDRCDMNIAKPLNED